MLRLSLRSVLSHKIRFCLTAGTVMIGVAFVVTSFVTADSLRSIFGDISSKLSEGRHFTVRRTLPFGEIQDTIAPTVPEELLDGILELDGVALAEGAFFVNGVIPVDGSGKAAATQGAPIAGGAWTEEESLSQWYLIDGERPRGMSEFAIDVGAFAAYDYELGESYQVVTPTGPLSFKLTGTMQFGYPENAGAGAVFLLFDTETAQEVLGHPDQFTEILVRAEDGADLDAVRGRIEALLESIGMEDVELLTAEETTEELSDAFESFIGPLQTTLLVFAFIVLFVSTFIIYNTFNIILGQRVRELSLLRSIGATPQQVRKSILAEAVAVGAAAVVVGVGVGMLGSLGMRVLFSALGASLPDGPLPLLPRTLLWAAVVGIVFTVVAASLPAVKASRIPPVAGLTDRPDETGMSPRGKLKRLLVGCGLALVGMAATAFGLFGDPDSATQRLSALGAGAAVVFVATAVLSPLVARAVVSELVRPLARILGISGRMAQKNAARNPRRTAATAISLTVGLALFTVVSIVGQSLKDSFAEHINSGAVNADFFVTGEMGFPKTLAEELRELSRQGDTGVEVVAAFGGDRVMIRESESAALEIVTFVTAANVAELGEVADLGVTSGSLEDFDPDTDLLVHEDVGLGITVGDEMHLSFVNGESRVLTVAAVYTEKIFWGDWIIDQSLHNQVATSPFDGFVAVRVSDEESDTAKAALEEVLSRYPQASMEDRQAFQANIESDLNNVLVIVNVFLGFSLFIALIGIVNTFTLSVFERTKELGLLRAVGMTKRQLRRMIRWEAAAVALYGAFIGILLGIAFGVATAVAIPDNIIGSVSVPGLQMAGFLALSVVFGLLSAVLPSYRASRMDILNAISSE